VLNTKGDKMFKSNFGPGLEVLFEQKNISIEEKRRIVATNAALDLIATAVQQDGSTNKLSEEFKNFSTYVDTIYQALSQK
jgi:hypothetical protein